LLPIHLAYIQQVRGKIKRYRDAHPAASLPDCDLKDVEVALSAITKASEWDGKDVHELVSLNTQVVYGKENLLSLDLPKDLKLPKTANTNTHFWMNAGLTTPMLQIHIALSRLQEWQVLSSIDENGPICTSTPVTERPTSTATSRRSMVLA
jgi:hypothetical protein